MDFFSLKSSVHFHFNPIHVLQLITSAQTTPSANLVLFSLPSNNSPPVVVPASAVCKKLSFDLIRSTRLTADLWDSVSTGICNDFHFPDPDVVAAAVSILAVVLSYSLAKLIIDLNAKISACFDSPSDNLRFSITETLGCVLARDDLVTLCENNVNLLDKVSVWWGRIGQNMLDKSDTVSKVAFDSVGRLFQELDSKRMMQKPHV